MKILNRNMLNARMKIKCSCPVWSDPDAVEIRMACVLDTNMLVVQPLEYQEKPLMTSVEPAFSLSRDEAQMLMDELWIVGLRPTEGKGSAGQMAATEKHLDDMRRLVFDKTIKVNA